MSVMSQTIDSNKRAHHGAGAPGSIGGQFAAQRSAEYGTNALQAATPVAPPGRGHLRQREDGRFEVADTGDANRAYGCQKEDSCILANGHSGDCDEDREVWADADADYQPRRNRGPARPAGDVLAREGIIWTQLRDARTNVKTATADGVSKLMADAVRQDRIGAPFSDVPDDDSVDGVVDDVIRESYADYGAGDLLTCHENLDNRIRGRKVAGDELERLLRRSVIVDRARRLGLAEPQVDYTGPMSEDKRRANVGAGGTYFTPVELTEMERHTKKCRGCGRGMGDYDVFPGGVCFECHEKTIAQDLPATAEQITEMWRR